MERLDTHFDDSFMILSRRIAWLLGNWVTRIPSDCRPAVYQILLKLMDDNDIVVQLTAAQGLTQVIDDMNFDIQPFSAYVPAALQSLLALATKSQEVSTKMQLINHLAVIIEQSHSQVQPFVPQIVAFLSQLWIAPTDDQGMMRSAIIRSIEKLVSVLEHRSAEYYGSLIPLVKTATDVSQPDSIYTLEDGMNVWLSLCRYFLLTQFRY